VPRSKPPSMYVIVAGGGKVGANLTRSLLGMGHEVTLIEQRRPRFERLQQEFGENVLYGDATELFVLERAGIARPPHLVLAVTGDDEDNLVISQIAREGYEVPKVIARVNDPRNQQHFDLLGITQTVCATSGILGLVEHEVPEHGLVRLLELRREGLELVEVQIDADSPSAGKRVAGLQLPEGSTLVSVVRNGRAEIAEQTTVIRPGDQVLAVLQPGKEDALRKVLLSAS
jgi:trk system potassium uptake protein TrkA